MFVTDNTVIPVYGEQLKRLESRGMERCVTGRVTLEQKLCFFSRDLFVPVTGKKQQ